MTEKRVKVINISTNGMMGLFKLGNDNLSVFDVARLLNELLEENDQLKSYTGEMEDYLARLEEKNEQLKSTINTLTHDNTKMKKVLNTTKKENEQIKQVIKEAYNNERTKLGQSVLKQLMEAIQ